MNAHRSLSKYRIRIPLGKRLTLYRNPQLRDCPALLERARPLVGATRDAVGTADGWVVIPGVGGLPLHKTPGLLCLRTLWEKEIVDVYKKVPGGWEEVEEWEKL